MGNGKICDCCMDFTSLLQSYDRKRTLLNQISDVTITREEIETIILYLQSWTQRQCSCCFREVKNFERFNWALQVLILVAVEIIKNTPRPPSSLNDEGQNSAASVVPVFSSSSSSSDERMEVDIESNSAKQKEHLTAKEKVKEDEVEKNTNSSTPNAHAQALSLERPVWDVEDKDKLLHFVSKLFLNSFPTYVAYKQHSMQLKSHPHHVDQDMLLTPPEIQLLSIFCEINEPEASPYLFRNVSLFCRTGGIDALSVSVANQTPETMPIQRVNILVGLSTNLKTWLNFQSLLKYYVPFRSYVMNYLCKTVDTEMKNATALRNMTEFIWSAVKEPVDAHISFDRDGLDLAFKYFLSPTLTMRLAGVNQINSYINLFNELVNSEHIIDSEHLDQQLCKWLLDNQLIQHIFGPNLHVEVIKQSHTILTFLAMEGRVTNDHVDIMWQAAQLKHCSKQVYDILSSLICNLEAGPVLHLHNLLKKLEPKDHTEQSLYLASALLKFIWANAALGSIPPLSGIPGGGMVPTNKSQRRLQQAGNNGGGKFMTEMSSSENSVSVDASHSEDDIQPGSPRESGSKGSGRKSMYKSAPSYLCKVIPTSSDESLSSNGESDEDPDSMPVSGAFPPSASNVETHSDSDADGERSGGEECPQITGKKGRRKVLRRKKATPVPKKRTSGEGTGMMPKKLFTGTDGQAPVVGPQLNKEDISQQQPANLHIENPTVAAGMVGTDAMEEPNVVISQLGNLVQMTDASAIFPDYDVSAPDNLDGSDGSYSSRMSNKSEKNMADFDGEDSNCDEDSLMQSLAQNQLAEIVASGGVPGPRNPHQQMRIGGLGGPMFSPRSLRRFNQQRKRNGGRNGSGNNFNFQIETVCQPGQTLLWDLVQDDKIVQLSDGLAIEAQKALTNLLCFSTDKLIRFKFIEGCLDNVVKNKSVVVSLRLLPKLLTSFQQLRLTHHAAHSPAAAATAEIHHVTLWAEREHQMLQKFFTNLQEFKAEKSSQSPFPYHVHVQVRLEFLSVLFSILSSPDEFRLTLEQVDQLWECLAMDCRCSDDLFVWLTTQVRIREQHALSPEAFRYILIRKIPSLPPTTITMHALTLFQQLCSMTRVPGILQDVETSTASMDYLWRIALCANSTDVSMTAIQYLNGYYIGRQLEKEEEFVRRCMSHLVEATEEMITLQGDCTDDEQLLLKIQRALVLLKTHLETFRRRYAYHLRKWLLEGRGVGSHAQLVGEKGAVPIRVVIQPAGYHEKVTLELLSSDYVADLRAEVAKWWDTIQANLDRCGATTSSATPVLGSLLTEGTIRIITQGAELSAEYDEKCLSEVPVKDLQLVYVSMGASRPQKKRGASGDHHQGGMEYSSSLPPPPRDKLPVTLLLQSQYFEQLFSLMQTLSSIKVSDRSGGFVPNTKAQVLSRRVWDILMLLPTNPSINEGFTNIAGANSSTLRNLLDPHSPQKLMYSLYIVEALVKITPVKAKDSSGSDGPPVTSWRQQFVECGGLRHLFDIFSSGQLETVENGDWSEWKQDCLASLLKILCFLGVVSDDSECLTDQLYDVNEGSPNKKRLNNNGSGSSNGNSGSSGSSSSKRRKISTEKTPIPRLNETMLSMMEESGVVMTRLTNILQACSLPRDPNHYKTGFWGRAQVVHYAMAMLVCWAFSCDRVRSSLYLQNDFPVWLRRLVLEDPEPSVRKEACIGLYRLCLGVSTEGKTGSAYSPDLITHLLKCLPASLSIKPTQKLEIPVHSYIDEPKDSYGPACRDYFWLLGRLIDSLDGSKADSQVDLHELACTLSEAILNREYLETRHNTICDDGMVGLLSVMTVVLKKDFQVSLKHNPPFKTSKMGQQFLKEIFDSLFALPSPHQRYLPKCKAPLTRSAAYDLLSEMARNAPENYYLLQNMLMDQHQQNSHSPYPWDYWPHEDGRSSCGYVGLTNLGATCYMASCMQHLYMMPQARAAILGAAKGSSIDIHKHEQTLRELQKMFAYLMESERKAYNPRSFCKVYQMDHQPLNTGEQKDMAEFFIDLVSKLEEMTPELKKLVKNLFCGVLSNNVVSLDCTHVSRTLEEFYTVRCQVADMRNLYESLDEVTVKDTLEGDNMYTCSQCGKKVRAEKRACFKKLPRILCFNTMRYTFNMITMLKEKVNTHFSFPMQLDMGGYVEKMLMPQQYQEEKQKKKKEQAEKEADDASVKTEPAPTSATEEGFAAEEDCYLYELIGVTVHTGTADGGHYYSFIRDRSPQNRDKWYLFNDAEVKPFDPNQLAAECFGGEMSTKTYDSVTDKFMDFSFEKTNSAYMLFYEQCATPAIPTAPGSSSLEISANSMIPCLPGGSSAMKMGFIPPGAPSSSSSILLAAAGGVQPSIELNKELEDWIWHDNTQFLRDKNIFEHTYFNFMSHVCGQIPLSLVPSQEDVLLLAAKLSVTFFLETYIHAKEKPTMMQWVEMITKPLMASQPAAAWLLDHMAETSFWPVKIFLKCPNQIVRQMFHRLCFHVVQQLRARHVHLYLKMPEGKSSDHPDDVDLTEFGSYSCVTRFIKSLLSLLENGAKSHLKHLTEYFTMLHDFSKMGDEECLFLINMQAIYKMVTFYLGNKRDDSVEHATDEEEDEDEIVSIPTEKNRVVSLEKMIALVATLVEKSRDESNTLRLSSNDMMALTGGGKSFTFILQQIRDGINFTSTRNLIFSLCRWDEKLAESIVSSIFQTIQKHPDICQPYFKVLNLLAELVAGPPGMPKFTEIILGTWSPSSQPPPTPRILDVADICAYPTLEWLGAQVPRNKIVHQWCLQSMDTWVEHFLIGHSNQRVRNAAASLLVSLVPHAPFRQGYRSTKFYMGHHTRGEIIVLPPEAQMIMHEIYMRLLNLLKPAKHYTDISTHGTSKLTAYFSVLTYFTMSKVEKIMFGAYFADLWNLFHPKLSEPSIPCHHNKQALLIFWHHVCLDCPENIQKIVCNPLVVKQIGFNYILADHEEQEVVMFNRNMLPAYYSILRMCCQSSRAFALHLARHQNITWAFKNIIGCDRATQYNAAVDELFKMMQIFVTKTSETSEQEILEINHFKRSTLQLYLSILDGRSNWATMISAFRILIETVEDRIFVVGNNGLCLIFEALHVLHTMHHEATACHVVSEIVELLTILTEILRTFRPKDLTQVCGIGEIQLHRFILNSKEWPGILSKMATLLNTYNHGDLRNAAIDCLMEFLYTMPLDSLRTLVPLMVHCHSACQDAQTSGMGPPLGPYFPKRSSSHSHHHGHASVKSSVRPPRPMLQMAFPHLGQETAKGMDPDYDNHLNDFYFQYHMFIDLMCRVAFMRDYVTQELITLSAMVGYEAAPLHFVQFPKLWLEVHNTPSLDRKYITMLVKTSYFTDYVELVMLEERACLTNIMIFNFFATFLPKVFEQVGTTDQMCKVLLSIVMDMENLMAKQIVDIESNAIGILGDLKALTLFYLPTCQQRGPCKNPLPAPAPSVPYLQKTLRKFQNYLETVMQKRIRDSLAHHQNRQGLCSPEAVPSKKRKLEGAKTGNSSSSENNKEAGKEEKAQCSSASSSSSSTSSPSPSPAVSDQLMIPDAETQRNYITNDLLTILIGTIESLLRGLITTNQGLNMESEEDEDGEEGDDARIIDVDGGVSGSSSSAPSVTAQVTPAAQEVTNSEQENGSSKAADVTDEAAPDGAASTRPKDLPEDPVKENESTNDPSSNNDFTSMKNNSE